MFDYPIFSSQMCPCRIAENDKRVKEDCYWYDEEQDMGAHIPFCKCHGTFPLESCGECEQYHSRYKRTHADRIRAMTDEELAGYLAPYTCPPIRFNKNTGDIVCPVNEELCENYCLQCWLEWLEQEG